MTSFPIIDLKATGKNISRLRRSSGLSVREIQGALGLTAPQAIYKWQRGESLPSVDNLLALSILFGVSMDDILVRSAGCALLTGYREPDGSFFIAFNHLRFRRETRAPRPVRMRAAS